MANSISGASLNSYVQAQIAALGTEAAGYLSEVQQYVTEDYNLPDLEIDAPWVDPYIGYSIMNAAGSMPTLSASEIDLNIGDPESYAAGSIAVPSFGNAPEFVDSAPTVTIGASPDSTLPGAPGNAPDFNSPTIPTTPTVSLPTAPSLDNIVVPDVPAYTIPEYVNVFPDDELTAPTAEFSYVEQEYSSLLLDEVKAKLLYDVINGGYGIEAADEQPLWERAREREMLAANAAIEQATTTAAARGFEIPPGAMMALVEKAQQEALAKISSVSREIALKRADMYVENRKFTLEQGREVESMLLTYHGYKMERYLKVAQYTADFGIQVFNAMVAKYNAKVGAAQAYAQAYEGRLRAALADLEAYKVRMEGLNIAADLQGKRVQIYTAQLEGARTAVDVYKTQMQAAQIYAEVEKLKLDAFRSRVEAYTAQVGAKAAEFQMFESKIKGEMAKVDVYKAQADAYQSRVQGYASSVQAKKVQVDALISEQQLSLDAYKAKLAAYSAKLDAHKSQVDAKISKLNSDVRSYETWVDASYKSVNTVTEASKANASNAISKAQVLSSHITNTAAVEQARSKAAANLSAEMYAAMKSFAQALSNQMSGIVAELQTGT